MSDYEKCCKCGRCRYFVIKMLDGVELSFCFLCLRGAIVCLLCGGEFRKCDCWVDSDAG